ncbi:hypothetical protein [Geminicoccus flavidas]|uniref:hypothetical protein n=1 Tax=Geminicoccus flavidas TaxID=2506407 RepID=UPI001358A829|nr:hypothetical protein [Geminicoccus flavidas]
MIDRLVVGVSIAFKSIHLEDGGEAAQGLGHRHRLLADLRSRRMFATSHPGRVETLAKLAS